MLPPDIEDGAGRQPRRRATLRRQLLTLLLATMLPLTVAALFYGYLRLESRNVAELRALSANARNLAESNRGRIDDLIALVRVAALNPAVARPGPACQQLLSDMRATTPALANLVRYDSDGVPLCTAVGAGRPYRLEPPFLRWLRQRHEPNVSGALDGPLSGRKVMVISVPLHNADGSFAGVMSGSIDVAWLTAQLRRSAGETAVAIIEDDGTVASATAPLPPFAPQSVPGSISRTMSADGRTWHYTVIPLRPRQDQQPGLSVVYAAPAPPVLGLEWWQTVWDFSLPLLAVLVAALAIWVGAQRLVVRWLADLQALALAFARGDFRQGPVNFDDAPREIRGVAATLYRMASAVEERNRRLGEAVERQRLLAREVHHRVKNNFQVVMSLLSLQSGQTNSDEARQVLGQARRRIGALALVHRLIYETGELASVSSRQLLGALSDQLRPVIDKGVAFEAHFDDVPLDIDNAVPLTLWMVEAVSAAYEHGFPDGRIGLITVAFRVVDGHAAMTVADDGVEPAIPDAGRGPAPALRLITALGAQLGGTGTVKTRAGGGVVAELRFPLKTRSLAPVPMPEP